MWKPMLPTLVDEAPTSKDWVYEIKYDGFRCGLEWTEQNVKLWSRNGKELTSSFPEITQLCKSLTKDIKDHLPLFLDGELVILKTPYHAYFSSIQQRGRLKSKTKIRSYSKTRPASLIIFDLVTYSGESTNAQSLKARRKQLESLFENLGVEEFHPSQRLNLVEQYQSLESIQNIIDLHQSEGIVAKQLSSNYNPGKRTDQWVKVKHYRVVKGVITGWNMNNDYFDVEVLSGESYVPLGKVKNGFTTQQKDTLVSFIKEHGEPANQESWTVPEAAVIDINCLDVKDEELREPSFKQFRFDLEPDECTIENVRIGLAQLPEEVDISKPDKLLFPSVSKRDYVLYLREVAPLLLPRLNDKRITMIRYPDGIHEHSFYQKHLPDYAPDFIKTVPGEDDEEDILCQDLRSLLWFGNHAALEFHVPFQTIDSEYPDEMVFDLDPPTLKEFPLAIKAALLIKDMVEYQGYDSLIKTSGKTGLQIHIPLEPKSMTFDHTREFMEAVATVLVKQYPEDFTIERLKKNRGKRLYIDYIQHAPGKTIVTPYSPRATEEATVATPLFWNEVNEHLDPKDFTIHTVPNRLIEKGCPFLLKRNMKPYA